MDLAVSVYLLVGVVAWASAQLTKYIVASIKAKSLRQVNQLFLSGNMPSAHSATVLSVATMIGLVDGFGSGLFALAATFAAVVMYDAVMVRRSSGEQGAALVAYFTQIKSKILPPRVAKGHSPLEVLVGALFGICVALIVFFATTIS
jgi:acid phosphatase family membrane protein YuiD